MSANRLLPWLDDGTLSRAAGQKAADPALWRQRYDPTCPSEFYRGYATVLGRVGDALRGDASPAALGQLIDAFDLAVKALPADQQRAGASFALMNVAGYAEVGTAAQVAAALAAELTCVAHCFVQSRDRGL